MIFGILSRRSRIIINIKTYNSPSQYPFKNNKCQHRQLNKKKPYVIAACTRPTSPINFKSDIFVWFPNYYKIIIRIVQGIRNIRLKIVWRQY